MEDNGRGLDPTPVKTPSAKGGNPDQITIMLIGSVGKPRSFMISRKFILYTLIFLFIYLITSLLAFYLYFDLFFTHRSRSKYLQGLEAALSEKTKSLEQDKLYTEGLEDYISTLKKGSEGTDDKNIAVNKTPQEGKPSDITQGKTEMLESVPGKEIEKNVVEVRDIVFRRDGPDLILDFKMANNMAEQSPAEGYIHIIALDRNKDCPSVWNNARNELSNGYPVIYRNGQQFLIQRFKPYQRRFNTDPDSGLPSFIRIIAYDRSGRLLLENEFPVLDVSANAPS